jgi:hypothetical protein
VADNTRRNQILTLAGFGVLVVAGLAWFGFKSFQQVPAFSDLPDAWFVRAIHADAQDWRLDGAPEVEIEAKGPVILKVIPQDRADVAVTLQASPEAAPAALPARPVGPIMVGAGGKTPCPLTEPAEAPVLTVMTPRRLALRVTGPVWADVGPAEAVMIVAGGCGAWRIGPTGRLWLNQDGAARFDIAATGEARVSTDGAAAVTFGRIEHGLDALVRGPGKLNAEAMTGQLDAEVWGRGRIDLGPGFAAKARLFVKGPGKIALRGEAGSATAEARVGGQIRIRAVRGGAAAGGDVEMGRPSAPLSGL